MNSLLEVIKAFDQPGTVLLLTDDFGEVNTAIRDAEGTWALGGRQEPHTDEKLTEGIEVAGFQPICIHIGGDL